MNRAEYVEAALRIQAEAEAEADKVMRQMTRRPWRFGATAVAAADAATTAVADLRKLVPPPEDRDEVERHFIAPLDLLAQEVQSEAIRLRRDIRRLRLRSAMRRVRRLAELTIDPADEAWCRDYGLDTRSNG